MTTKDARRNYWNETYRDYWMQRVAESNTSTTNVSTLNQTDKLSSSDQLYADVIQLLHIQVGATVLEMGCGFGRSIPLLMDVAGVLHAIDISAAMIEAARARYGHLEHVHFYVTDAESTPFEADTFDNIVCFAVFDAMYQGEALREMNRVLKNGGRILLTGKNDWYHADDEDAYIAEVRAREKHHPNYFTDVRTLFAHLSAFGFTLRHARYYPRRGDFTENHGVDEMPDRFYEFLCILEKTGPANPQHEVTVSAPFSRTWHERQQ